MKTKPSLVLLLFVAAIAVAGCSGVPISTLWHFWNFGPQDLLKTDPAAIRAAVQLKDGVKLEAKNAELDVEIKYGDEAGQTFKMPLALLKEGPWVGAASGEAEPGKHWYLFALSPEGVRAFRSMQQYLSGQLDASGEFRQDGNVNVNVDPGKLDFDDAAKQRFKRAGKLFMKLRLELSPDDGFYTLYEGMLPIKFKDSKKPAE